MLAETLGVMVADLRQRMTQHEFVLWSRYHARKAQAKEIAARQAAR